MKAFITQTGLGYIREIESEKIVSKCDLPIGEHRINNGFEFVQVNSRAELAAIIVTPKIDHEAEKEATDRAAIQAKIEEIAVRELKADGFVFTSERLKP